MRAQSGHDKAIDSFRANLIFMPWMAPWINHPIHVIRGGGSKVTKMLLRGIFPGSILPEKDHEGRHVKTRTNLFMNDTSSAAVNDYHPTTYGGDSDN